jgi:hypothetical protein
LRRPRAAGDGPSAGAEKEAAEATEPAVSGNVGLGLRQKVEVHLDTLESCRKEAIAKNLGLAERVSSVRNCMK